MRVSILIFLFLLFKISKNENKVKILSVVEYDFLNPNWFSSNKKTSSENTQSAYFSCDIGVRQRENLSPFLFALFLNDLQSFLEKENLPGLKTISEKN
jgi:hypothetical protein